ncbi:adult-specific cuticular protein ACP-20-like [Aricia agestis]|uniref:adult-specific cuticular protein ACP-20-like n=1 Tax=Aricia agestis TaxID=91739 RepID=UPI001C20428E|nr:adult-specific cuticular protein ACP-20-like [Aricia agestis]
MFTFIAITCLLGVASAAPSGGWGLSAIDSISIPNYGFNYAVNDPSTGDNKAQSEVRNGDVVKGQYSLAEPDGTIRVVDYTADAVSGFNAVVKRIGAAQHPPTLRLQPIVSKPISYLNVAPVSYSSNLIGLGGLGHGLGGLGQGLGGLGLGLGNLNGLGLGGLGLESLGLSGLGLGGWKH